eukprot:scaffold23314_cov59-Phaeocystis_antarctica.AAC.2
MGSGVGVRRAVKPACCGRRPPQRGSRAALLGQVAVVLLRRSEEDLREIWAARGRFSQCMEQPSTRQVRPKRPRSRAVGVASPKGYRKVTTLSTSFGSPVECEGLQVPCEVAADTKRDAGPTPRGGEHQKGAKEHDVSEGQRRSVDALHGTPRTYTK